MNIRLDKNLSILANHAGKTPKEVETIIVSALIKNDMIEDNPNIWGYTMMESIERSIPIIEVINVVKSIGIDNINSEQVDAFFSLVFTGKGNCPICGGEMQISNGEYKCCGGDGYLTPYDYQPIFEEMTCKNCGHTEKI